VGTLRARLSKASANGPDRAIAELVLERFLLGFVLTKFDMKVDINLRYNFSWHVSIQVLMILKNRSISAHTMENGKPSSPLLTSSEDGQSIPQEQDLVRIKYHRVQKESPEYLTVHEGIDQTVDVELSTFIFSAAPEPVLYLYDFMMSTFVSNAPPPGSPPPPSLEPVPEHESPVIAPPEAEVDSGKIRVRVNLTSVQRTYPYFPMLLTVSVTDMIDDEQ
jgi:vacuolar protein sorting-associated protein 13A/C